MHFNCFAYFCTMFGDLKPIIFSLFRFFGIYFGLTLLYQFYLNYYENLPADPATRFVAKQSSDILNYIGYRSHLVDGIETKGLYFYINEQFTTRMVEGCNAISVAVLFLAFIFAFYKGKTTYVFAFFGLIFLYVVNVLRICALNMVYLEYPDYFHTAHEYFFPAIIYGGVVLLWIIWIRFFAVKR